MHAGKNMGIMTTLEKNLLQKGRGGAYHWNTAPRGAPVPATFAAHGSSVICPLLQVSVWLAPTALTTGALPFRASPWRGLAPSR